eukprot:scaffold12766_cov30-Phaeocystis_antarctica.AAC.1
MVRGRVKARVRARVRVRVRVNSSVPERASDSMVSPERSPRSTSVLPGASWTALGSGSLAFQSATVTPKDGSMTTRGQSITW